MLTHRNLVAAVLESVDRVPAEARRAQPAGLPAVPRRRATRCPSTTSAAAWWCSCGPTSPSSSCASSTSTASPPRPLAPTMLNFLLQHPKIDEYDLSTLRNIGYGAAAMPVEVLKAAIDRFGPIVYSGLRHDRAGRQRAHVPEGRPHPRRQGRGAPARLVRRADVPGQRAGGRRPHERVPARRGRRDRHPGRAGAEGLLAQRGGHRRPPSTAAGSTPATWPSATRRASSTSSTARRT